MKQRWLRLGHLGLVSKKQPLKATPAVIPDGWQFHHALLMASSSKTQAKFVLAHLNIPLIGNRRPYFAPNPQEPDVQALHNLLAPQERNPIYQIQSIRVD